MIAMPENIGTLNLFEHRQDPGGGLYRLIHTYDDIISIENLLEAWQEFVRGKRKRKDVQEFQLHLIDNIFSLYLDLKDKTYHHGPYYAFNISDPKPRNIHKATVRDRLLHHAIYRILYPYFDKKFISDSYSCRLNKGTHKANQQFQKYFRKVSKNNTGTCWVLKCDIRKFFANINHGILLEILKKHIPDEDAINLLKTIMKSFHSMESGKGLPLGNLTSQLLVNIYMNEFDQFLKHKLKAKYYIRYADDFVLFGHDRLHLTLLLKEIDIFLNKELKLSLHPDKVYIKTYTSGVDFLGWVHFSDHRVLRTTTKKRMFRNLSGKSVDSYRGLLKHGNAHTLRKIVDDIILE